MKLYKCKVCGFCKQLSAFINFNDNGTITERLQKDFRAVWIESDFIAEVFKRIENDLGVSVQHVIFEAQKASSKAVINSNLKGIFAAGRIGYSKNIAINIFCNLAIWTGMGYAEAVVYKPKKYGEAILRNPFNREMMAANIVRRLRGPGEEALPAHLGQQKGRGTGAGAAGRVPLGRRGTDDHRNAQGQAGQP